MIALFELSGTSYSWETKLDSAYLIWGGLASAHVVLAVVATYFVCDERNRTLRAKIGHIVLAWFIPIAGGLLVLSRRRSQVEPPLLSPR